MIKSHINEKTTGNPEKINKLNTQFKAFQREKRNFWSLMISLEYSTKHLKIKRPNSTYSLLKTEKGILPNSYWNIITPDRKSVV